MTIDPHRAPSTLVAPPFLVTGVLFAAALLLLALVKAPLLAAEPLRNPATLAAVHLFTLGFAGSVATGALYQIVPVMLHSTLPSETAARLHLPLHAAGVALLAAGFLLARSPLVITGGTLVVAGAVLFLANLGVALRRATVWNWHGYLILLALLFYAGTLATGLLLALNQRYGFWQGAAHLQAHLTLGFGGWFGLLITGVALKLIPKFAPAEALPQGFVEAVGLAMAAGVPLLAGGAFLRELLPTGALLTGAGILGYAGGVLYAAGARHQRRLVPCVRFAATGALVAVLGSAGLLTGLLGLWRGRSAAAGLLAVVALGWIGGTILGMLLQIIPFMVWLHRFRARGEGERLPFLHEMFHPLLAQFAWWTWFPGAVLTAAGIALRSPTLIRAGGAAALAGLLAVGCALAQALSHLPRGAGPLYRGRFLRK